MKKITLILLLSTCFVCPSQSDVITADYDGLNSTLAIFSAFNDKTALYEIDLRDCKTVKKVDFNKSARNFTVSKYIPSLLLYSSSNKFQIYDAFSLKTENIEADFTKSIRIISQSEEGKYFAVSDGLTAYLFTFAKEKPKILFKKEFAGGITAILPDTENEVLYTAERSGTIAAWSFDGRLISAVDTKTNVNSFLFDGVLGRILVATRNGLYSLDKNNMRLAKIINDNTLGEAYLDNFARRLTLVNSGGATLYDYPSMRKIALFPKTGGRIVKTSGANFAAFARGSSVELFDIKLSIPVATVSTREKGVFFYPPENGFSVNQTGVTTAFIDAVVGNKNTPKDRQFNIETVCAPVAAMVSGIYYPENSGAKNTVNPNKPETQKVDIKSPKNPFGVPSPKEPSVKFIDIQEPAKTAERENIKAPTEPQNPMDIADISEPKTPGIGEFQEPSKGGIPHWIASRKNLPPNQAVGGGRANIDALIEAETKLKNTIVKDLITKWLNSPEIAAVKNGEIKKRFLWQASSAAALELIKNMKTTDEWTSPAGMKYILTEIHENTIKKTAREKYETELQTLRSVTPEDYMKIKPNKIE